jgi:FecR protein
MNRTDPPNAKGHLLDADELLRAFVEQPVAPLPEVDANRLRDQVTRALERRPVAVAVRGRSERWQPWLLFAAAACLPVAIWAGVARVHAVAVRHDDTAIVRSLVGSAEIAHGDVAQSIEGTGDAPLGPGDELRTGRDASARASLPTGAVVDVGPLARVRFSAMGSGAAVRDRLELAAGHVDVRVPKLAVGSEVRVETPDATVVVHGTKFSVDRIEAVGPRPAGTRVSVTEGVVTVDTDHGRRTLTAGMELSTPEASTAAPTPEAPIAPSADDTAPAATGSGASSTLAAENALLADAMRLRRDGQTARALALVDAFVARYPHSPLMETARAERQRLVETLRREGPARPP